MADCAFRRSISERIANTLVANSAAIISVAAAEFAISVVASRSVMERRKAQPAIFSQLPVRALPTTYLHICVRPGVHPPALRPAPSRTLRLMLKQPSRS